MEEIDIEMAEVRKSERQKEPSQQVDSKFKQQFKLDSNLY